MNTYNIITNTPTQNAQQYLTNTQIVSPIKKETLIKPQNHNLFNNPDQYYRSTRGASVHAFVSNQSQSKKAFPDQLLKDDESPKTKNLNYGVSEKRFFPENAQRQNKLSSIHLNPPQSPGFDLQDDNIRINEFSLPESENNSIRNVVKVNPVNMASPRDNAYSAQQASNNLLKTPKENITKEDQYYKNSDRNRIQIFTNTRSNSSNRQSPALSSNLFGQSSKLPIYQTGDKLLGLDGGYDISQIKELNKDNFLKYIHPKQRETIYLLFGEKRDHWQQSWQNQSKNEKDILLGDTIFNKNQETALTYYDKLDKRAEKLKDRLRDTSKIVSHMLERRKKFLLEHEELIKSIEKDKDTLEITQKTSKKKVFERDIQLVVEQIKLKIEDLKDKYRGNKYIYINSQNVFIIQQFFGDSQKRQFIKYIQAIKYNYIERFYSYNNYLQFIKEANDLIVIFSIASNHYLNENQNWSSNTIMDLNSNHKQTEQNQHGQTISKSDQKFIQSAYNYQSVFHQSSNMLDFDSRALQIYQEFQQQIRNLDQGLNEYKKYLKLDIEGEEFNIRTQELLQILKQCQTFTADADKEIILLNQELGIYYLSYYQINFIKKQILFQNKEIIQKKQQYRQNKMLNSILEFINQLKKVLIYQSKFKEMNEKLQECTNYVELFVSKCYRRKQVQQKNLIISQQQQQQVTSYNNRYQVQYSQNDVEIKQSHAIIQSKISEIQQNSSFLKKQVKQLASDPRCQYFIQLRFKQCNKIIQKLQSINIQVENLMRFFQLVSSRLDEDLNEIIQFQEQMKKNNNDFVAILQIKEHKRLIDMLKQLYLGCNILMSTMRNSIDRLNCYTNFNQKGQLQKNFIALQTQLQNGIQETSKFQDKVLLETKKKGKSEQVEQNLKKLEEFSELCSKEIDSFRKQKDTIFFNFQESDRYHTSAMVALGNARQGFQIMSNMKDDPNNPHLQQIQKQITQQKNTLELCNCILENSSYLQLQNFQYLAFIFKIQDSKLDFDTNLDELLQGVDDN